MNKEEIIEFLNKYSVAVLATTDGKRPYLRSIWTVKSDEKGILFHTGKMKEMYKQILNNQNLELLFINDDKSVQIRVSGQARQIEDKGIKNELLEKRAFLKDIEKSYGSYDFLSVFLLEECSASVWTMATNMIPKEYIRLN